MAKNSTESSDSPSGFHHDEKQDSRKICGIAMPIASMGEEYSEAHWQRVKRIIQKAVDRAGMRWQLVWENPEVDVIQTAILKNLYENDVVVCDVSGLNPNVMLETGLRLSTKRPTIIVTDKIHKPPFDIGTIGYIDYQKDLEYNAIEDFIGRLSKKISEVLKASQEDRYKSYVEQFQFETVTPATVTVTSDEYIRERLDGLAQSIRRLEQPQVAATSPRTARRPRTSAPKASKVATLTFNMTEDMAKDLEVAIDEIPNVFCVYTMISDDEAEFVIYATQDFKADVKEVTAAINKIFEDLIDVI